MKTWGSGCIAPPFLTWALDGVTGQLHAPAALPPGKEPPVPILWEAGWAPEPVWTLWRKQKYNTTVHRNLVRNRKEKNHYTVLAAERRIILKWILSK
jgi:hypothetical protein